MTVRLYPWDMGLFGSLRALVGPAPVDLPSEVEVRTANLSPDTDEKLVIVTLTAEALARLSRLDAPLRLLPSDGRAVTFERASRDAVPVLDPARGWVIPVSRATAAELAELPAGPGEYELSSIHLALVVEG